MAYESPMDAARRRAGLKSLAEAQEEERKARLAEHRERYGRVPRGDWRTRQDQGARSFPGRLRGEPHAVKDVLGWVYIAGAYDRDKLVFVKIGYTGAKNPNTRVRAIAQGVPHRVELLAAIAGSPALELSYHREFYPGGGPWRVVRALSRGAAACRDHQRPRRLLEASLGQKAEAPLTFRLQGPDVDCRRRKGA